MNRRGMTFIEILLALSLLAVLGTFVVGTLRTVIGLWQTGESTGRHDLAAAAVAERFRGDLLALHTGPSGWLVIDEWIARAESETAAELRLPRLRFLASDAVLPIEEQSGAAIEVMWALVPDESTHAGLARLVRWVEPVGTGLRNEQVAANLLRDEIGLELLDGVAWLTFTAEGGDAIVEPADLVALDFPKRLAVQLERVSSRLRMKPVRLASSIVAGRPIALRGRLPNSVADHALIDGEWVEIRDASGAVRVLHRAVRSTREKEHEPGAAVLFPSRSDFTVSLPGRGRRWFR